jgi:hypothetical protein
VKVRVRRTVVLLVLLLSALVPASAFADVPLNDTMLGAETLQASYAPSSTSIVIFPTGAGGWLDAAATEDAANASCLGQVGYHSMWYKLELREASVVTITLTSQSTQRYQPVVTILDKNMLERACGLGGNDQVTDPTASASSFLPADTYFVRIASVQNTSPGPESPTLRLSESLQDVTPPEIQVAVSGKLKIVGPNQSYRFDASASSDAGSGIDWSKAQWLFFDGEQATPAPPGSNPQVVTHAWATAGLHKVTLQLQDETGNVNSYTFDVFVHNFVPPKVSLRIFVPTPGSRQLRIVLTHDMPIRVRLSVLQGDRVLRSIPWTDVKGSRGKRTLNIALRKKVGKGAFVVVSGVASDIGENPNIVPLLTCSVDPVNGGGACA